MKTTFFAALIASTSLLAGAATAETVKLHCQVKNTRDTGWISPDYLIQFESGKREAVVIDGVTHHFTGGPAKAKLVRDNDRRAVVDWSFDAKDGSGQRARMNYSVTYYKKNGKFKVVGRPADYKNTFNRGGTCKVL